MPQLALETVRDRGGRVLQTQLSETALQRFPPPSDLTSYQQYIWKLTLQDLPLKMFKERNLHLLRRYCEVREAFDGSDFEPLSKEFKQWFGFVCRMESLLGITINAEYQRQRTMSRLESAAADRALKRELNKKGSEGPSAANDASAPHMPSRQGFSFVGGRPS